MIDFIARHTVALILAVAFTCIGLVLIASGRNDR